MKMFGVKPGFSKRELRKAYKLLAPKLHPDRDKTEGAHERFISMKAAYDRLNDNDPQNAPPPPPPITIVIKKTKKTPLHIFLYGATKTFTFRTEKNIPQKKFEASVTIKAGAKPGKTIVFTFSQFRGTQTFNIRLFVKLVLPPSKFSVRSNGNIVLEHTVNLLEAMCAPGLLIPNPWGGIIYIPMDRPPLVGETLRLPGHGFPAYNGFSKGDLLVRLNVDLGSNKVPRCLESSFINCLNHPRKRHKSH